MIILSRNFVVEKLYYPTWGLYHSNWVGFNIVKLRISHKLPYLEGALILY